MNLLLITHKYPFTFSEAFLENEISFLSQSFEKVYIVPVLLDKHTTEKARKVPDNCEVILLDEAHTVSKNHMGIHIGSAMKILVKALRVELQHLKGNIQSLNTTNLKVSLKHINGALNWGRALERKLEELSLENLLVYSYWFDTWLLSCILLREKYPQVIHRIICRAHRYDIYFENSYNGYLPLRPFLLRHIDVIYPISYQATHYLKEKISLPFKARTSYLGVLPKNIINGPSEDGWFRIVSCSTLIPRKRVGLLLDAIDKLEFNVQWTHIGDGPLRGTLKEKAEKLGEHVSWHFTGNIPNTEVNRFYESHPVDLFVNTSESEGIPVSIMEAMSFGIPVIATSVGGTPEILSDGGGKLVPVDIDSEALSIEITKFRNNNRERINEERKNALKRFQNDFNANVNYNKFCQSVLLNA